MAGNSQRKGAIRKTSKKPTAGSGGQVRRGLEGKGPTPKAKDRPYHKAHRAVARTQRAETKRPKRRTTKSTEAEWVAGRNSVLEVLRAAGHPVQLVAGHLEQRDARLGGQGEGVPEPAVTFGTLGDVHAVDGDAGAEHL